MLCATFGGVEEVEIMAPRANRVWLLRPVAVFALIALIVGRVATGTVREPYATPFFPLFFRDVLQMKAWLATAAVVLASGQLLTAARMYELLRFPPKGSRVVGGPPTRLASLDVDEIVGEWRARHSPPP